MSTGARRDRPAAGRLQEAADWFTRWRSLTRPETLAQELEAWDDWLAIAPNQEAFRLVERAYHALSVAQRPALPTRRELTADEFDGSMPVSEWRARMAARECAARRGGKRRRRMVVFAAALAVLVLVAGLLGLYGGWLPGTRGTQVFQTTVDGHRNVTLADGSRIFMGAGTRLSVTYTADHRTISLRNGDALFKVAHDRARPFVVVAGGGTITAVGTQFNVREQADRVTVTVAEGTVEVAPRSGPTRTSSPTGTSHSTRGGGSASTFGPQVRLSPPTWQSTRLSQGQQLSYGGTDGRSAIVAANPEETVAWREGRLQYRAASLRHVVADINRYYKRRIVVGDTAAGDLQFTGTVFQDDVGEWLLALEKIFPVQVIHEADGRVVIESRRTP